MLNSLRTLIAALLATSAVGCSEREPHGFRHVVALHGNLVSHDAEGNRKFGESFYAGVRFVPSETQQVERPLAGHPLEIGVISATARSVDLTVTYRGDTRQITHVLGEETTATFGPDAVEIFFGSEGTSIPPLQSGDPILKESVVIRKYDYPATKVSSASGAGYNEEKSLNSTHLDLLRKVLTTDGYLTAMGADCFEPGMEFEIGEGVDSVLVIVCLECCKLRIARKGDDPIERDYGITNFGVKALNRIYEKSFP